MRVYPDLRNKINTNQHEIFITETQELLAAWIYKKSSPKRSKNLRNVPNGLRCSHLTTPQSQLIPCHVSITRKAGQTQTSVTPVADYSTKDCHAHGMQKEIMLSDLNSLEMSSVDRLEAITLSKKWFAPFVSPIFDSITLARVTKDLGIFGKAIPKVIDGRQYIAFSGYAGIRTIFTGTIYSSRNTKVVNMAIGSLGIAKKAFKGGDNNSLHYCAPHCIGMLFKR